MSALSSLAHLQDRIKRDPESYRDEFLLQVREVAVAAGAAGPGSGGALPISTPRLQHKVGRFLTSSPPVHVLVTPPGPLSTATFCRSWSCSS